jgi:hypothetical protein
MMAAHHRRELDEQDDGEDFDEEVQKVAEDDMTKPSPKENDKEREERLQATLFELRKMNEVFGGFLNALEGVKEHNEVGRAVADDGGFLLSCDLS